jgi:hypothetical protein
MKKQIKKNYFCSICNKKMINAAHGIGYYCSSKKCNTKNLTIEDYQKLSSNLTNLLNSKNI